MDVNQRVSKAVAYIMNLDVDEVTLNSSAETLGLDSLDKIEIIMNLEDEFDIEIPDVEAEKFENASVYDMAEYIRKRTGLE